jgi:hypothetical protein
MLTLMLIEQWLLRLRRSRQRRQHVIIHRTRIVIVIVIGIAIVGVVVVERRAPHSRKRWRRFERLGREIGRPL